MSYALCRLGIRSLTFRKVTCLYIFQICLQHDIKLQNEWIPRTKNDLADCTNRIVDFDDWQISPNVFSVLDGMWDPHTVDRLASFTNAQLGRFSSKFWCPGTEGVDTFTTDWSYDVNWLAILPPLHLIAHTIQHARAGKPKGTLAFPAWKSTYYWPRICPNGHHLADFIHRWCY